MSHLCNKPNVYSIKVATDCICCVVQFTRRYFGYFVLYGLIYFDNLLSLIYFDCCIDTLSSLYCILLNVNLLLFLRSGICYFLVDLANLFLLFDFTYGADATIVRSGWGGEVYSMIVRYNMWCILKKLNWLKFFYQMILMGLVPSDIAPDASNTFSWKQNYDYWNI